MRETASRRGKALPDGLVVAAGFNRLRGLGGRRQGGIGVTRNRASEAGEETASGVVPVVTESVRPAVGHVKALDHSRRGATGQAVRRDVPSDDGVRGDNG